MTHFQKATICLISIVLVGCGSDSIGPAQKECEQGQQLNPITSECTKKPSNNARENNVTVNNGTPNNSVANNSQTDTLRIDQDSGTEPVIDMGGDMPSSSGDIANERCAIGVDNDNDGLDNACECELGTNLDSADTDNDGIEDADEDADGNCRLTVGVETDARQADTDADGANDKEELMAGTNPISQDSDRDGIKDGIELNGCTDPLSEDSDSDSLPDGVEDSNLDGVIGTCANRVFDPTCAQGESDPCKADTDDDGTPDSGEAEYRNCRPEDTLNLPVATMIENAIADYKVVVETEVVSSPVTALEAHVFEDSANKYTGFILSFDPNELNPSFIEDRIVGNVQGVYPSALRRVSGRRITSHDTYRASVGSIIDLPDNTGLHIARDQVLAAVAGIGSVSHSLSTNMGSSGTTLMISEVLSRNANQAILIATFVDINDYQNESLRNSIRVDDLTRGPALAKVSEAFVDDCVSYDVTVRPKVDIIISLDASGSMIEEQALLSNFATEFSALLDNANIDWRVGVTGVVCEGAKTDMGLPQDFRDLLPEAGGFGISPCMGLPFSLPGKKNGELVGTFTNDPVQISANLDSVSDNAEENTATMAIAAMARASNPRSNTDLTKFRPDASVVLISITDEEDVLFENMHAFLGNQNLSLSPTNQMTLDIAAQPFIDYMLKPEFGATMFGLYWLPGEACNTASKVAHAVSALVIGTGGGGGSVCQADISNTLAEIASATAGIASGLRLRGTPLTTTLGVLRANVQTGNIDPIVRSRADGFDYDAIVNRVAFTGPSSPQTNDRVVMPYRRWENSVFVCTSDADCPSEQKLQCIEGECR